MAELPPAIGGNPRLDQWLSFDPPGAIIIRSGKVELGQGILTALVAIAAAELQVDPARIRIGDASTAQGPDEGITAGSLSVMTSGEATRTACTFARGLLIAAAAARHGLDPIEISVADGACRHRDRALDIDYWNAGLDLDCLIEEDVSSRGAATPLAHVPRRDLPAKISGAAFIHDFALPGMLHGRVVRPPAPGTRLLSLPEPEPGTIPGFVHLLRDGDFVAVACAREEQAVTAAETLRSQAIWGKASAAATGSPLAWLDDASGERIEVVVAEAGRPAAPLLRVSGSFSRLPIAHASIAPSCAVARFAGAGLELWTHSQGIQQLRAAIATAIGMAPADIVVHHLQGAGSYGHNGADDAAFDAVLLARALPGRPVRVQWSREEELSWSPLGAPMAGRIDAAVAADGSIVDWRYEFRTGPHVRRPGLQPEPNLLAATLLADRTPLAPGREVPSAFGGGGNRNAIAPYAFASHRIVEQFVPDLPWRTSSLRSLGAHHNVFAIESMMDEIALRLARDPLALRLAHLEDERGRAVLRGVADRAGWRGCREPGGDGRARGLAYSRYKNSSGYAAIIAAVEVDERVRVTELWCVADIGRVVHRDGALNQIEGGMVQSLSWALHEGLVPDAAGRGATGWEDYPILRFPETPRLDVTLIEPVDAPSLGAGEIAQGPATAAVANAVARAIGHRIPHLPMTRERIIAALAGDV